MKPKQRVVKKSKLAKLAVPADLKSRKLKKFKTKDRKFLVLVVPAGDAFDVVRIAAGQPPITIRKFDAGGDSQVSDDIRRTTARELALWYGRHLALHNMVPPSARKERSRRRSVTKKALAQHQTHQHTKSVIRAVSSPRTTPPRKPDPLRIPLPYVFLYDPKGGPKNAKQPTTFVVHQATCPKLDGRRRAVRKRGASWIVEETSAERAIAEQIREFESEDKGYDRSDFTIHHCELC